MSSDAQDSFKEDERIREATERFKAWIYESADWLPTEPMAAWIQPAHRDAREKLAAWRQERRILAVDHDGLDFYPKLAVSPERGYRLCPALAQIIEILGPTRSDWKIAFWLVSPTGYLGDGRPQDFLWSNPDAVVNAARLKAIGIQHG